MGGWGCRRGGGVLAETIFWVQLPGNNEISRFNSWASAHVKIEKKTKVSRFVLNYLSSGKYWRMVGLLRRLRTCACHVKSGQRGREDNSVKITTFKAVSQEHHRW